MEEEDIAGRIKLGKEEGGGGRKVGEKLGKMTKGNEEEGRRKSHASFSGGGGMVEWGGEGFTSFVLQQLRLTR